MAEYPLVEASPPASGISKPPEALAGRVAGLSATVDAPVLLRRILVEASDAIIVLDQRQHIVVFNQAAEALFGYRAPAVLGHPLALLLPHRFQRQHAGHVEDFATSPANRVPMSSRPDVLGRRADGVEIPLEVTIAKISGPAGVLLVAIARDATVRREVEAALLARALHDPLTGLANRTLLLDQLERALAGRAGGYVGLMLIDLDDFKVVNDGMGHLTGDHVLRVAAARLQALCRPTDTVARYGGDEFVLLCSSLQDEAAAHRVAQRVPEALAQPIACGDTELFVSASVGLACVRPGDTDAETLLARADAALYRAKDAGGAHHQAFTSDLRVTAAHQLRTETDLHRALERDELRVHYQPIVDLATGTPLGLEALVRWQHPQRGLLAPAQFLPEASHTGLITAIDSFVLAQACRAIRCHRDAWPQDLWLAVNVSARQLGRPELPAMVAAALSETGLPAGALTLEVTESALLADQATIAGVLGELKRLGVRIAIDDFGTGHASLACLRDFPADVLKADRAFVVQVGRNRRDTAILAAVARLARDLDLQVVAEGVEEARQVPALLQLGFTHAQGHHFAAAQPAEEVDAWMTSRALTRRIAPDQVDQAGVRSPTCERSSRRNGYGPI